MTIPANLLAQTIKAVVPEGTDQISDFVNLFEPVTLKTDDYFVTEGAVCSRIGFIMKGMIRHYYVCDSTDTTRWVSVEGEFVTSLGSFIQKQPSSHFLQAIAPCDLLVISKTSFDKVYENSAVVQKLWLRVIESVCLGFEDRIYMQLSSDAEKRYLYMMEKWPQIIEKVPQKYVASMMGVQPESLSRIRAKLQKRIS